MAVLAGCVDEQQGSNVQFDFSSAMPVQGEALPENIHFTLYAFQEDAQTGYLFALQRFEIHRIVDLNSPCFIDVGEHVPHPGLHVSQYANVIASDPGASDIDIATAEQRQENVTKLAGTSGIKVVTSASASVYPEGIPAPDLTDDASNKARLAACQAAWKADPLLFEGTDRILTAPLNGITHGTVDGLNPINMAPVGGAQFFVDQALAGFDGFAVYWQFDDANQDGHPDYPPGFPEAQKDDTGQLLLFGTPTMPTRGVMHVHMTSTASPNVTAELAIFANLGEDDVHF